MMSENGKVFENLPEPDVQKANTRLIEEVRDQSVQPRATYDGTEDGGITGALLNQLAWFYQSADVLPPWWSAARDRALAEFWRSVDLLKGAMYAMTSKMATIPFHIEPRDRAITSHFKKAMMYEKRLKESAEFGEGWGKFIEKQMQSLLGQDNGRFMEIIDANPNKLQPIIGEAISVAHIDPSRVNRTGNPEYPITYLGRDGKRRRIHYTRVAIDAQMPSEREDMYGVGLCAVSRAASYGQNMLDITKYKEEKLGSRPLRGIMLTGGGLDAQAVGLALQTANDMTDSRGLTRFSNMPIVGDSDIEEPKLELIQLSSLPDGFDEEKATAVAMAAIALAFGVDARELWPASQTGATRADAVLSHIKQQTKGPGHIIAETERMFNQYFLPPYLKMVFDFQDDAQDRQRAEIERERSLARKTNLEFKVSNERTERQRMMAEGTITEAQFKDLELSDGRLPDGKPLQALFFIDDPIYNEILDIPGLNNPTDIRGNDAEKALNTISKQKTVAYEVIARETGENASRKAKESLAALIELEELYSFGFSSADLDPQDTRTNVNVDIDPESNQREEAIGAETGMADESPSVSANESSINSENDPRELR